MNNKCIELKEFLLDRIYPKFGEQPSRFRYWDKRALRSLYMEYIKPQYHHVRNNPEFSHILKEVERNLEHTHQ